MKLEKSVVAAIVVLVALAAMASGYYGYEKWLETQPSKLEKKDFAEIYYIGYFENGSVFASSFQENATKDTPFDEGVYNLTSLKLYFEEGYPSEYPEGWDYGDLGAIRGWKIDKIEGLYEGMRGMKEDEERVIGPLPPEKGFGRAVVENLEFTTNILTGIEETFIVRNITEAEVDVAWVPEVGKKFTMPSVWGDDIIDYPYWLWENATEILSFNDTYVQVKTTPGEMENLTLYSFWENKTKAIVNETTITLITTPDVGSNFTYYYYIVTVEAVTEDKINVSIASVNETTYWDFNRTIRFNKTTELSRLFNDIPWEYLENDFEELGYSFHELAGNTLYYRVKVLHIYKVS